MEIIKRNIVLFVVIGISLLVSIVLVFLVVQASMTLKNHQAELVVQKDKIKKLIEEKPAPLKGNLDAISSDITMAQQKVNEIHLLFGKPYRAAIQAFAEALGVSENTLYTKWRASYEKEKKIGSVEQIFLKFMGDVLNDGKPKAEVKVAKKVEGEAKKPDTGTKKEDKADADAKKAEADAQKADADAKKAEAEAQKVEEDSTKVEAAVAAFKSTFEAHTLEELDQENLILLIIEGLGLSRTMSPEVCTAYVSNMDAKLNSFVKSSDNNTAPMVIPDKTSMFTVIKGMPQPERIPLILKHYKMIEDLVYRMKGTSIRGIVSLTAQSLDGVESRGFLTLTYKIQIVGSMNSIRDFINNLQDAYKENRVYIVKDLVLKKLVDEMKNLTATATTGANATTPVAATATLPAGRPGIPTASEKAEKAKKDEAYGAPVIGSSSDVVADLKIDYVIYIADEIKKR